MIKKIGIALFSLLVVASSSYGELTVGARYYSGTVAVVGAPATPCYVEALYSGDFSSVVTRAILPVPHLSPTGELQWLALGPYTAGFIAAKSVYRYQDATPAATIKDLVLNVSSPGVATKFGVAYWHASAGHHDPIFCEGLIEATTQEQLEAVDEAFSNFETLKTVNP